MSGSFRDLEATRPVRWKYSGVAPKERRCQESEVSGRPLMAVTRFYSYSKTEMRKTIRGNNSTCRGALFPRLGCLCWDLRIFSPLLFSRLACEKCALITFYCYDYSVAGFKYIYMRYGILPTSTQPRLPTNST